MRARILKQPKAIIYENVERILKHLVEYFDDEDAYMLEELAKAILAEFKISYGKKTEIDMFENNVQAVLENSKITIQTK